MEKEQSSHTHTGKVGFLFNVDILIEDSSSAAALEKLLSILHTPVIKNYKIVTEKTGTTDEIKNDSEGIFNLIDYFRNSNTLVRLTVVKSKGVKLSIPCRILNFDSSMLLLTVYHVDEKKVYQFHLSEIDDFKVN